MAVVNEIKKKDSFVLENFSQLEKIGIENSDQNERIIDDLLYEAVERRSVRSVLMILNYTVGHGKSSTTAGLINYRAGTEKETNTKFNPTKRVTPSSVCKRWRAKLNIRAVILAAQKSDYELMRIFIARGFNITKPHDISCKCWICHDDPLAQTKERIAIYRALCNPLWISLTKEDPLVTAFDLCQEITRLEKIEDSYENCFKLMKQQIDTFCVDFLDCVNSTAEQYKLLNMVDYFEDTEENEILNRRWSLKLIKLAFRYKIKKVVAHPVPQHAIASLVFDDIPRWQSGGNAYRLFYVVSQSLMFPITSFAYIFAPCSSFGQSAQQPMTKFISGAASFVTFLGLLAWIAASPLAGIRKGELPTTLESVIFVWLISLMVAEINQLSRIGWRRYLTNGWNWMDIAMILFMLTSYIMWTVLYFVAKPNTVKSIQITRGVANGLFTCGTILSFFRLVFLCQITRFLGLLQLCLGKMVEVIFQFAFISFVVLWSFSVGMVFLQNSISKNVRTSIANTTSGQSNVQAILNQGFHGLPATLITMSWASLNLVGLSSLKDFDDGGVTYLWSAFLFTMYYVVSMIVMLNMLIAMMSNSYQQIENNIEVEHKFAKTQLWADYLGSESILPCPFNLIPTWTSVGNFCRRIKCRTKEDNRKRPKEHRGPTEYQVRTARHQDLTDKNQV